MHRLSSAASALALAACLGSTGVEAVQRAFVASYGSDANTATNCGFANPCRAFSAAMTVVDSGGEVVALDAAGYGNVLITKSVTLTSNPGFFAGISAASGNAVLVSGAGIKVTLRGLSLNGVGAQNGIFMGNGAQLSVENCVISNFATSGIVVSSNPTLVRITNTTIRDNASHGVQLNGGTHTSVTGAHVSGNGGVGIFAYTTVAGADSTLDVADSTIDFNNQGLLAYVNGVVAEIDASVHGSRIVQNSTNGIGSNGGTPGALVIFAVSHNIISNNTDAGVVAFGSGRVWATTNTVSYNGIGFNNTTGIIESAGDNAMRNNTANTAGTITAVAKQ